MTTRLTSLDVPYAHDKITLAIDLERVKKIQELRPLLQREV